MPNTARTAADLGRPIETNPKIALVECLPRMNRAQKLEFAAKIAPRGGVYAELGASVRHMARVFHGDC